MTFSHVNRRLHLYLALALLPWFFMYGISSLPFAHNQFFEQRDRAKGLPPWTLRSAHAVDLPVPEDPAELRRLGVALLELAGIADTARTTFGVYRQSATQINVYSYTFWKSTQLKYFVDQKKLTRGSPFPMGSLSHGHARARWLRTGRRVAALVEHRRRSGVSGDRPVDRDGSLHVVGSAGFPALGIHRHRRGVGIVRRFHDAIVSVRGRRRVRPATARARRRGQRRGSIAPGRPRRARTRSTVRDPLRR